MPDTPNDWIAWTAHRRQVVEQPDEALIQIRIERWKVLLADESVLPDEVLDREMAELLVRIHRAC